MHWKFSLFPTVLEGDGHFANCKKWHETRRKWDKHYSLANIPGSVRMRQNVLHWLLFPTREHMAWWSAVYAASPVVVHPSSPCIIFSEFDQRQSSKPHICPSLYPLQYLFHLFIHYLCCISLSPRCLVIHASNGIFTYIKNVAPEYFHRKLTL